MAGIVDLMKDVLAQLAALPIVNNDNRATTPYVRVWNDQLKYDEDGNQESYPKPAYFLEIVNPVNYEVIGEGYRSADVLCRIHIVHEYYNSPSTYAQDLVVFALRDQLVATLTYFKPAGCGPLTSISEQQDTSHNNLYHLLIDFVCNFTDAKGSKSDDGRNVYIEKTTQTNLQVDISQQQFGLGVAIGGQDGDEIDNEDGQQVNTDTSNTPLMGPFIIPKHL